MLIIQVYDQQYITEATKEGNLNLDEKVVSLQKCINQCKHVSISDKDEIGTNISISINWDENNDKTGSKHFSLLQLPLFHRCSKSNPGNQRNSSSASAQTGRCCHDDNDDVVAVAFNQIVVD